jgi:hypothetical protein
MIDMNDNTRRDVLKLAGTTAALGFAGSASATRTDGESSATASRSPDEFTLSYDVRVRNNAGEDTTVSLSVDGTDDANPLLDGRRLPAGATAVVETLRVPGGEAYTVEVTLEDGTTASYDWGVPDGGVPDWMGLEIHVRSGGRVRFYAAEI